MESEKAHLAAQIQVWKHETQDNTLSETLLAFIRLALRGNFAHRWLLYRMWQRLKPVSFAVILL